MRGVRGVRERNPGASKVVLLLAVGLLAVGYLTVGLLHVAEH